VLKKLLAYSFATMLFFSLLLGNINVLHEETRLAVAEQVQVVEMQPISYRERLENLTSRGEIRKIEMTITAYDLSVESCGKSPDDPAYGITYSGEYVKEGYVAVDPNVIPIDTRVYIEGYGLAIAKDTGGAIKGNRMDIFMPDYDDCIKWGKKIKNVYILGKELPKELRDAHE